MNREKSVRAASDPNVACEATLGLKISLFDQLPDVLNASPGRCDGYGLKYSVEGLVVAAYRRAASDRGCVKTGEAAADGD